MMRDNPFDVARAEARRAGACPVNMLDEFFTNHATFDELCWEFHCEECVATPEDMGLGPLEAGPAPIAAEPPDDDWEIPF